MTDPALLDLLDCCLSALGLRQRPEMLVCDGPVMPMTWGVWRARLVLPSEVASWPEQRRRLVLLHELAHIARHDCLTQSIAQVARALYWFNPLAWLAVARIRAEQEIACDDLAMGPDGPGYAEQLLAITASLRLCRGTAAGVAMAHRSRLEERVRAALDTGRNRRPMNVLGIVSVALLTLAAVLPLACASAGARSGRAQPSDSKITGLQPTDEATSLFARRLRQIGLAITEYVPANGGHLPQTPGRVLEYVRPPGAGPDAPVSPATRAAVFLSPADEKTLGVPAQPTPEWVNEHASIVYLGHHLSPHGAWAVPDWSKAVIAYSKFDRAAADAPVLLLFLDGHVHVARSREEAERILAESRAATAVAFPEYLHCASRLLAVARAIGEYAYDDKHAMHLPPDLGATFVYMRPNRQPGDDERPVSPSERARQYICTLDDKRIEVPAQPTAQWVTEHASFVYLGSPDINIDHVKDWGRTAIAHDRLDHAHSNAPVRPGERESFGIRLAFLDAHTEGVSMADAERIIAESKKALDAARDR